MARTNHLNRTVRTLAAVAGLAAATLFGAAASAQSLATTAFTYQGELQDAGSPANGTYDLAFKAYNSLNVQVGPSVVANDVSVVDGKFTASLDFGDLFNGQALSLEISVRPGDSVGVYSILSPRQALTGTPYAQGFQLPLVQSGSVAGPLVNLTNQSTSDFAPVMRLTSGGASGNGSGIGFQPVLISDTNDGNGIASYTSADASYAYYGRHEGQGGACIVLDHLGTTGRVAWFRATDAANTSDTLDVSTAGLGSVALLRATNAANASNTLEVTNAGTGSTGFFDNNNTEATKPTLDVESNGAGESIPSGTQDNGIAIKGQSNGSFGIGVMGRGVTAGVFGYSGTTGGAGVLGRTDGGGGSVSSGVRGEGNGAGTVAISAFNNFGTGVYALADAGGTAVFASNGGSNSSGYAGDFQGRVRVQGNLSVSGSVSKGSGTFKIDHPMDPENKFLYHSFVESPDMKNIYDGVVTLDASGAAVVTLPEYFNSLNKDYRYQLTCVGGYAPVYIAKEVANNTFEIAGGKPGLKVSWTVTGIRQDPYANINRVQPEVEKSSEEKGKYLYPEAYGKPESMRIGTTDAVHAAPKMN